MAGAPAGFWPAGPLLLFLLACAPRLGIGSAAEGEAAAPFTLPSRGVALLAALCLLVMMTEGAMADWSGILMRQDLGASEIDRNRGDRSMSASGRSGCCRPAPC